MNTYKLSKCFACHSGYPCDKKNAAIPRKRKKQLKKFYDLGFIIALSGFRGFIGNSCSAGSEYKEYRRLFNNNNYFFKHKDAIAFLLNCTKFMWSGDIIHDDKLQLGFHWERDNGLYTTEGVEPFHFKPQTDNGWQYEELKEILSSIKIDIDTLENEKQLLRLIDKKLRAGELFLVRNEHEFSILSEQIEEGWPIKKPIKRKLRIMKRIKKKKSKPIKRSPAKMQDAEVELPF